MQQEVTINLSVDQVNTVLAALADQPFKSVAVLIGTIKTQAMEQLEPQAPPVEDPI